MGRKKEAPYSRAGTRVITSKSVSAFNQRVRLIALSSDLDATNYEIVEAVYQLCEDLLANLPSDE